MKTVFFTFLLLLNFILASSQSRVLIPYRIENKWGYSDTLGKIKIPVKYDTALLFDNYRKSNGRPTAILRLNKKAIVIDNHGNIVVPAKYDNVAPMPRVNDIGFMVSLGNKYGVYTNGREIIPVVYDVLFLM